MVACLVATLPTLAHAQAPLASGLLRILGARLTVQVPANVPINTPFSLPTQLVDGDGHPLAAGAVFAAGTVFVRGDLSGVGLDAAVPLDSVAPGSPLAIPALTRAGNYVVDHLRLTDILGAELFPATPAVANIKALEQIFVTSVTSRPLSLDEIQSRGIVLDANNFSAYEFTFGVATESPDVRIPFQMVFPTDPDAEEGSLSLPPIVPSLPVPNFDIQGFVFKAPDDLDGIQIPPIPGVIVIPGNIAFLHEFFQVQVLASNVTPPGSQLIITSAAASLSLPLGDKASASFRSILR